MRGLTRIILALLLVLCIGVGVANAQTPKKIYLTFAWEQAISDDFYGWKMWYGTTSGGPYNQLGSDIVYDGVQKPEYTCDKVITAPSGSETTFYFVVNAWDKSGNFSADSNEVSYKADFLPPNVPVLLHVTVQSGG